MNLYLIVLNYRYIMILVILIKPKKRVSDNGVACQVDHPIYLQRHRGQFVSLSVLYGKQNGEKEVQNIQTHILIKNTLFLTFHDRQAYINKRIYYDEQLYQKFYDK